MSSFRDYDQDVEDGYDPDPPRGHYVLIDGPSMDSTLGRVIDRPPSPETRPDWRRLEPFVKQFFGPAQYAATFVIWEPGQQGFLHFLRTSGFEVEFGVRYVPGRGCADVIRDRISRLQSAAVAAAARDWQVIVGTHNVQLIESLPELANFAKRISVFGFSEHLPDESEFDNQIGFFDIEDDANLFRTRLPRPEPSDEFDEFLDEPGQTTSDYGRRPYESHSPYQSEVRRETPRPIVEAPIQQRFPTTPAVAPDLSGVSGAPGVPVDARDCYLIVDGRSIEKELGEILGEKPNPGTRPDWSKVLDYAYRYTRSADGQVKALFVHIAPGHAGFRRALKDLGYTSRPVRPDASQVLRPVVEEFICGLLAAKALRGDPDQGPAPDIIVLGHGQPIFDALSDIPDDGQRLRALGFPERMPPAEYYPRIEQLDLEHEAHAFGAELPREFGVDVDNFDPDEEFSRLF